MHPARRQPNPWSTGQKIVAALGVALVVAPVAALAGFFAWRRIRSAEGVSPLGIPWRVEPAPAKIGHRSKGYALYVGRDSNVAHHYDTRALALTAARSVP